jgi:hypothetical protein
MIKHFRIGNRGNALVEFSIVLLVFFGLILSIFEFGRLFYIQFALHSAVREASRFTTTGRVLPDPDNPGMFLSRIESVVAKVQSHAPGLNVDQSNVSITGPNGPGDTGGPGDVVTIRVTYDINLLTPMIKPLFTDGIHHYTVAIVTQNELFDR